MGINCKKEEQQVFHEILSENANRQIRKKSIKWKAMHGKILNATSKDNKVRKKSHPSKWTSHKRAKGVIEPAKMMYLTNLDDKKIELFL